MADIVTNPEKIVTDEKVKARLTRRGYDWQKTEFHEDYTVARPHMKTYRMLEDGKHMTIVKQLPRVNPDGEWILREWELKTGVYHAKANTFYARVTGVALEIENKYACRDGSEIGDKANITPQLYLDDIEEPPKSTTPVLLTTDPINGREDSNTLEWDFGIIKRRSRLIRGKLQGYWYCDPDGVSDWFDSNPDGKIRFKYNATGVFKPKLGQWKINEDEEEIDAIAWQKIVNESNGFGHIIWDLFYPDTGTGNGGMDCSISFRC